MQNMTVAKWIGLILKIVLAGVCAVFIGSESLLFFNFIFPADKFYLAYTGFGLTMGAFFVYLYLLLKDAETPLQKTIALLMMVVGLLGELATAGFGMLIEGWAKLGWTPQQSEYEFMILVIRIAVGIHGVALVLYWFGDTIGELMRDQDGDGIPNIIDNDYKPAPRPQQKRKKGLLAWLKSEPEAAPETDLEPLRAPVPLPAPENVGQLNLSSEQMIQLAAMVAGMTAGQGTPVNGKVVTDPQSRQS